METKISRPLNMDEKKKLEKIIYNDIDRAKTEYEITHNAQVQKVKAKAVRSAKILKLAGDYNKAQQEARKVEKELNKMGFTASYNENSRYDTNDDEDSCEIRVGSARVYTNNYGTQVKEVKDAENKINIVNRKLEEMKRTYTLKLFAGGLTEAENVFADLANELAKITA
jgi:hypothetical protein